PSRLRERLVQREAACAGRAHGPAVPGLARGEPARARRGGAGAQGAGRPGGGHRPGGPARVGRGGPRRRRRPEDRRQRAARGRAGPAPAARRLPAGRAARRVRAVRPGRAGRGGAGPGGQGGRRDAARQGAAAGRAGRGRRARLGQGPGGDRRGRHGRTRLRGPGEPRLPHLPGRRLLSGQPRRRAGHAVTPARGSSRRGDARRTGTRHAADMTGWPGTPVIYEVNTAIWLGEQSRAAGRPVTLADVPASAWDEVTPDGIDAVWLMGVWERSPAGLELANANAGLQASFREALPDLRSADVIGSPYCVRRYVVDASFGGPRGLAEARAVLAARGIRLLLDYVPNHVAPDHPWVTSHPDLFVNGDEADIEAEPGSWVR